MNELTKSNFDLSPENDEDLQRLIEGVMAGMNPHTQRAYALDFDKFRQFVEIHEKLSVPTISEAAKVLLTRGHGRANLLAMDYKSHLMNLKNDESAGTRKLSANTINRRLAALRSIVAFARKVGMIGWSVEVDNLRVDSYKDIKALNDDGFQAMLEAAINQAPAKAARDTAILMICGCSALRRAEVFGLDLEHFDLRNSRVSILGKMRHERQWITIPPEVLEALENWISHRGSGAGPLFPSLNRVNRDELRRLSPRGFYAVIKELATRAGLKHIHPHDIRHYSIDTARKLALGDNFALKEFSRHASITTTEKYISRGDDSHGRLSGLLGKFIMEQKKLRNEQKENNK